MKKCTKCGIDKPLTAEYYYRKPSSKSGFFSQCKVCVKERHTKYQKNNREKILKAKAEYRKNNKEKIKKQRAKYYQNNKEKISKYRKSYVVRLDPNQKQNLSEYGAKWRNQRNAQQPGCIYQIVNSINNKIYIGETIRGKVRWSEHIKRLQGNRHGNHKLQKDFDKFGEEAFEWSIIKEVDKDKDTLLLEEIKTIDRFLKEGKELYNLSLTIDQLKLLMENK